MTSPSSSLAKGCAPLKHLSLWGTLGNLENLILWSISGHLKQLIPWGHLGHLISWSTSRLQGHLLPCSTSSPAVPQPRPLTAASPSAEHHPPRAGLLTRNIFPPQAMDSCLAGSLAGASGQSLQLGHCTSMYPSWGQAQGVPGWVTRMKTCSDSSSLLWVIRGNELCCPRVLGKDCSPSLH